MAVIDENLVDNPNGGFDPNEGLNESTDHLALSDLEDFDEYESLDVIDDSGEGLRQDSGYEPQDTTDYRGSQNEPNEDPADGLIDFDSNDEPNENTDNPIEPVTNEVEISDEEMINKLREKGYNIQQGESPEQEYNTKVNNIQSIIDRFDTLLQAPDEELIRLKLKTDFGDRYKQQGQEHLVGSQDFLDEVESEIDAMSESVKSMFAQNVRNTISGYKQQNENELNALKQSENQRLSQISQKNRTDLANAFNQIYKEKKFLGINITPEILKEVYRDITNYEFSKRLNSDQSLIAEVALYLKFRDNLRGSKVGDTYGAGVRDAVYAINNGNRKTTRSPLSEIIDKSSNAVGDGNGRVDFESYWNDNVVIAEEDKKPVKVAGKTSY